MTSSYTTRPVVAGIDGSAAALRAARFAADEAARRHAPLRLVHALAWPFEGRPLVGLGAAAPDTLRPPDDLPTCAEDLLRDVATSLGDLLPDDRIERIVEKGHPVTVLEAASAEAQLVVVGGRGVGGVAGLLIGSTASGLLTAAHCPLVVLPDEAFVAASGRRTVVVGVSGRGQEEEVLAFAVAEAAARGTDLIAVHAWQDVVLEPALRSVSPLVDWAGVQADEERALAEELAGWHEKEPDVLIREVVIRERTARALVSAALTAELLVVGRRDRGRLRRLGSAAHGAIHRAGCPVAIVPVRREV